MEKLIINEFNTPIGLIECKLSSNFSEIILIERKKYLNGLSRKYQSRGHQIELIEFKSRTDNLVENSNCWIFRIVKHNELKEIIKIKCELIKPIDIIDFDTASGEHLDAIEAYNEDYVIHIGTEDGEIMNLRAQNEDWFPNRLKHEVNFHKSITKYLKKNTGFKTEIPILTVNERIHIQYLSAVDRRIEGNLNCWFAVDELKRNLENWIGVW